MSFLEKVGDVTEIESENGVSSLEWRIPDFLSLTGNSGDYYNSHLFDSCNAWCFFKIYPFGLNSNYPSDWIPVFLHRLHAGPTKAFKLTLGIRGAEGVVNKKEIVQEFSEDDNVGFCWHAFCSRSKLAEQKSRLMPGGVLVITLDIMSGEPRATIAADGEKDDEYGGSEKSKNEAGDKTSKSSKNSTQHFQEENIRKGIEKVVEDIGNLLASGEKSDVTVLVDDVEFKAHSLVLYARCRALSVSLQHESKEKASNRIIIEDSEPDIVRDFLQYLYVGSVRSLTEKNAFGLYNIADKYLTDDLKQMCLEHIQDTMSVPTFCDAVRLALMHEERDLLERAMEFATKNIRSIIRTVEWQHFIRDCPTEANEILIKSLGPAS